MDWILSLVWHPNLFSTLKKSRSLKGNFSSVIFLSLKIFNIIIALHNFACQKTIME